MKVYSNFYLIFIKKYDIILKKSNFIAANIYLFCSAVAPKFTKGYNLFILLNYWNYN